MSKPQPLYHISIPNTQYVKFSFFPGGPKNLKNIFNDDLFFEEEKKNDRFFNNKNIEDNIFFVFTLEKC